MSNMVKALKLDFALLGPYLKALVFILVMPILFIIFTHSLVSGVSFAMCMIGMATSYTFAVSEKNGMDRLYGLLPISRKALVGGKYLCTWLMGLIALVFSLVVHSVILIIWGTPVTWADILVATVVGIVMFTFYAACQIPAFYKYGTIKGRVFMYVPIVGFLLVFLLFTNEVIMANPFWAGLFNNPWVMSIGCLGLVVLMWGISIVCSVRIMAKKEW